MSRCEHCQYRNSWECDDGWNRRSNDTICDDFKLDYDTLTNKQKNESNNCETIAWMPLLELYKDGE